MYNNNLSETISGNMSKKLTNISGNMYNPWKFQLICIFPKWNRDYTYSLKFLGIIHIPWLYIFPVTYTTKCIDDVFLFSDQAAKMWVGRL